MGYTLRNLLQKFPPQFFLPQPMADLSTKTDFIIDEDTAGVTPWLHLGRASPLWAGWYLNPTAITRSHGYI